MSQDDGDAKSGQYEGGEDIEAFLRSLEEADAPDAAPDAAAGGSRPVATAQDTSDLDARFAALDDLVPDELPAKQKKEPAKEKKDGKKKKSRKERAAEKKAAKKKAKQEKRKAKETAAAEQPAWKRFAKASGMWALMALPMLIFVWILGSFMAHVISAAWLVAFLMIIVAVGLPLLVANLAKRGKVAWWAAGLGVLLTILLVAPMPQTAGNSLTHYGHWPASAVGEVASWQPDNGLANVGAAVSGVLGSALGADASGAMKLGTMDRLDGSVMPVEPKAADGTPESATPAENSADELKPEARQPENTPE